MSNHLDRGRLGEKEALSYLQRQGYQIVERNWRHKRFEIDIIAKDNGILTFVEVKTRKSFALAEADFFVNRKKQNTLLLAAEEYLFHSGYEGEVRFDIVAVYLDRELKIELIKDAFWSN